MLGSFATLLRRACCTVAVWLCVAHACFATPAQTGNLKAELAHNAALPVGRVLAIDELLREPRLRQVRMSPDGTRVSYLEKDGATHQLKQLNVKSGKTEQLLQALGPAQLTWSGDSSTIFVSLPGSVSTVAVADRRTTRIAVLDEKQDQKLHRADPGHPHHVLIEQFDDASQKYRLTRLSKDGARETIYEGRKLLDYLIGADGKLSFATWLDENHIPVIMRRHGKAWTEVARCHRLDDCQLVTASGKRLTMIMAADADRAVLADLDWVSRTRKIIHSDPAGLAELRSVIVSPGSRRPLFATYESPDFRNVGLTPEAQRSMADIGKKFIGSQISIEASETSATLLLTERGAQLPQERYWIYDSAQRKFVEILRDERAAGQPLAEADLARTIPMHYPAGDGMMVHGYLTLPPGRPNGNLPLMTIVHGGPWARSNPGYSPLVQLLANRGVAVFQPNFRASVGYGQRYMLKAGSDFGAGRVQDDIIDGVRWLLARGVGDRHRLAIMGHSFGGYSTLLALSHTPQLFQFGMAIAPPPNFADTLRNIANDRQAEVPGSLRLRDLGVEVGNPLVMKKLNGDSPRQNAAMISKPLLIMAGGRDEIVPITSIIDYVARVQEANTPVSLMIDRDEGHNVRKPIFQIAQMYLLEHMVQRYLGGPRAEAPSPKLNDYLRQTMVVGHIPER